MLILTCDYSTDAVQVPTPRPPETTTSHPYKYLIFSAIIAVAAIVIAVYNSTNSNHFVSPSPTIGTVVSGDPLQNELAEAGRSDFALNNLPNLPGPFVGRDEDIQRIVHELTHSRDINMVHITGLPAVGKSTLAIHVGYEMARHGVEVQYINVDETHNFMSHEHVNVTEKHDQRNTSALSTTGKDIELFWYSPTKKKYYSTSAHGLIQWAKGLSNATVLIIDNCDSLLEDNVTQKALVGMFVQLNKASRFLCIISTSRLKVRLLDGFKQYKLKPLDNKSAVELLQSVSDGMTLNDSRTVNGLVGGIPLALKIVGSLVGELQPPNLIIRELEQNLIETLTPEDVSPEMEKMRPVLELSFKYLDTRTQECALYLSHFPGSFTKEAALDILKNCNISNPDKCLTNLFDRSLLDAYSNALQPRYQFHKLINEYLTDVESQKFDAETSRILRFNSSFLIHYTKALSNFVIIYNERSQDKENIYKFKLESHNFECLLEKVLYFDRWPVIAFVKLTRALTSQLMLESFSKIKLLKVGQRSMILLEDRMEDISDKIGAFKTLSIYHDLVLQIRKWMQTYQGNCSALCKEIFLQNISSRCHVVNKQLVRTNLNTHDYYNKLRFPYYYKSFGELICFIFCFQTDKVDTFVIISISAVVLLNMVIRNPGKCLALCKKCLQIIPFWFPKQLGESFCFSFCLRTDKISRLVIFTKGRVLLIITVMKTQFVPVCIPLLVWYYFDFIDVLFALSLCIVIYISEYLVNRCLLKATWMNLSVSLLYYLYIVPCVLLTINDPINMMNYIFICSVTAVTKLFNSMAAVLIYLFLVTVFCVDSYVHKLYIVDYVSSIFYYCLHPYYVRTFEEWQLMILCTVFCIIAYM